MGPPVGNYTATTKSLSLFLLAATAILLDVAQFKLGKLKDFFQQLHELKGRKLEKLKPAATTTYGPPTATTDSCTQLVWETDANGEVISVLRNVCGTSTTTTTTSKPPSTTSRPTTTSRPPTTATTTTTTDRCTQQLVWETDANGEVITLLRNIC